MTLTEFAERLGHTRFHKKDIIADTRSLAMIGSDTGPMLDVNTGEGHEVFKINKHAHGQLASWLKIPKPYYDRLRHDHPDLLAHDVSALLNREHDRRMVRTLDGTARAFLSDKFRVDMDNFDVANAALPILYDVPDLRVLSLGVTDTRMYIKAEFPRLRSAVKVGDEVTAGIVISNSEVGAGSLRVEPLVYRLICSNGMIAGTTLKKFHVGARHGLSDEAYAVLSQETREKAAEALQAIVTDVVKAATDEAGFKARVENLIDADQQKLETTNVPKAVEVLGNKLNLTQEEQGGILKNIIEGGSLTRWGIANAVTRLSQDVDDYDRATELERAGGNVISLARSEWEQISVAA